MENKRLHQLATFRIALWTPIILGIITSIYIICSSNLTPLLGYEGLNNLFTIFKIPLYIVSLCFPLVALVAANHRSQQTSDQIKLSLIQNEASIRPLLELEITTSRSLFSLELHNKGQAVAILENGLDIFYREEKISIRDLKVEAAKILEHYLHENENPSIYGHEVAKKNVYIQKDVHIELLKFTIEGPTLERCPELITSFWNVLGRAIKIKVNYKSLSNTQYKLIK